MAPCQARRQEGAFALTRKGTRGKAARVRDDAMQLFSRGGSRIVDYLNAQREYNDVVREYRDLLVRHRRSMLALNTALGLRILP